MKSLYLIPLLTLFISCRLSTKTEKADQIPDNHAAQKERSSNFDWLKGQWKRLHEQAGKETFESWEKLNDMEYRGTGFTLSKGDTISQEFMQLLNKEGQWRLIVQTAKDKASEEFLMSENHGQSFTCVNDTIDFPNRIQYWMDQDTLKAKVSKASMEIPFAFEKMQ